MKNIIPVLVLAFLFCSCSIEESRGDVYYELLPDTAMTNLYYSDIDLKKLRNSVQMTIGAHFN